MNGRTKLGLKVLEAALLLGALGDALLRATPWGLNVLLWAAALAAATLALADGERRAALRAEGGWLFLPALFFAAAFAWRDSPTLRFLDALAVLVALALVAWRARGHGLRLARLTDYARGLGRALADALFAPLPLVLSDVRWQTIPRGGLCRHLAAVARGLLIAAPLLLLFGGLFVAADAVFERIVARTFNLDGGVLFSHVFLAGFCAWVVAGYLRGLLLGGPLFAEADNDDSAAPHGHIHAAGVAATPYTSVTAEEPAPPPGRSQSATSHTTHTRSVVYEADAAAATGPQRQPQTPPADQPAPPPAQAEPASTQNKQGAGPRAAKRFSLGAIETGVVLGLLDLLFAAFVLVQARYLFGGAAWVTSAAGLTYAEYARRGFFELVWVAALSLPLLLCLDALLREGQPAAERVFRALAGAQVALLFVIMASGLARMRLYQREYGLTELRLYTTAFMLWLGAVFVWFAWTALRGARLRFAHGALTSAFAVLMLLHLLNPDATIVRANATHARAGRAFDAAYAADLSADAAPALASLLPALGEDARRLLARQLLERWPANEGTDWRTWNLSRARARAAMDYARAELRAYACRQTPAPAAAGGAAYDGNGYAEDATSSPRRKTAGATDATVGAGGATAVAGASDAPPAESASPASAAPDVHATASPAPPSDAYAPTAAAGKRTGRTATASARRAAKAGRR